MLFRSACSVAAVCGAGIAAGLALSQTPANPLYGNAFSSLLSNLLLKTSHFSPMWGSLSLSGSSASVAEPKTGMSFPSVLKDSQRLLGIGLRKKAVLGLKNIDVYAFGNCNLIFHLILIDNVSAIFSLFLAVRLIRY